MKQLVKVNQVGPKSCLILNVQPSNINSALGNPLFKPSNNYRKTNGRYNNRNKRDSKSFAKNILKTSIPPRKGIAHGGRDKMAKRKNKFHCN